jgi:hypothetical protein
MAGVRVPRPETSIPEIQAGQHSREALSQESSTQQKAMLFVSLPWYLYLPVSMYGLCNDAVFLSDNTT